MSAEQPRNYTIRLANEEDQQSITEILQATEIINSLRNNKAVVMEIPNNGNSLTQWLEVDLTYTRIRDLIIQQNHDFIGQIAGGYTQDDGKFKLFFIKGK